MRNEWRDNVWVVLALTLVSLAVWLFATKLEFATRGLFLPRGFNPDDVYQLKVNKIYPGSHEYVDIEGYSEGGYERDLLSIVSRLRANPYVESVAMSYNGNPYSYCHIQDALFLSGEEKDTIGYPALMRFATPDLVSALGLTSRTGKSTDELTNILERGEMLITSIGNPEGDYDRLQPEQLLGKTVMYEEDKYKVGDIIDFVRVSDYGMENTGMAIVPVQESEKMKPLGFLNLNELTVRVKPGMGKDFEDSYRSDPSQRKQRNVFLTKLLPLRTAGKTFMIEHSTSVRLMTAVVCVLMLIVCLGISGVFWFRTQQRIGEIAIRKVCGASKKDILRRVIAEGLLLVVFASILTAIVGWIFIRVSIWQELTPFLLNRYILLELMAFVFIAIGVTISVWWPARRAMKIEPAIAIKDE